jgi:LysM repeat protein
MKRLSISVSILFTLITSISNAQQTTHFIKKGESISTVARQYHTSVKEILKANYLTENSIISIGQKIVIPASGNTNVAIKTATPKPKVTPTEPKEKAVVKTSEVLTKVNTKIDPNKNQHLIVAGDNLTKIARQYHTTEKNLLEWNNLKNDIIKVGGYLNVENPQQTTLIKEPTKKEVIKPVEEVKMVKTEPVKKIEPVKTIEPQPAKTEIVKVDEKPNLKEVIKDTKPTPTTPTNVVSKVNDSFFESQFVSTKNAVEGTSGTFKTITGWHDKKYYALINNAENGSIVKITANNKTVYAKVLGPLPNIKSDNNLSLRVSNAAAAALGVTDRFDAKVEF